MQQIRDLLDHWSLATALWIAACVLLLLGPLLVWATDLGRGRMVRRSWLYWLRLVALCGIALVSCGLPFLLVADPHVAVGWSGFALSIWAVFAGERLTTQPVTTIHFVGKSRTRYTDNVATGFRARLKEHGGKIDVRVHFPPEERDEDGVWQADFLSNPQMLHADGVAIVVATPNDALKEAIALLRKKRVPVVLIDYKIENRFFDVRGVGRPWFVGSNFPAGGAMVGRCMADYMRGEDDLAVFLVGPPRGVPSLLRCQSALLALSTKGGAMQIVGVEIPSWRESEAYERLKAALASRPEMPRRVLIFTANDAILEYVDRRLAHDYPGQEFLLFGYDGAQDNQDRYLIQLSTNGVCTADVKPRAQGERAADILLRDITYPGNPSAKNSIIEPELVWGPKGHGGAPP